MVKPSYTSLVLAVLASVLMIGGTAVAQPITDAKKASAVFAAAPVLAPSNPLDVPPDIHPPLPTRATTQSVTGPFIAGTAYWDANFQGGQVQQFTANYGPCDASGYRWHLVAQNWTNTYWQPAWKLVSSIRQGMVPGSRCNRATVTSGPRYYPANGTYGRKWSTCVRSTTLQTMGFPWNDNTEYFALNYDPSCPLV